MLCTQWQLENNLWHKYLINHNTSPNDSSNMKLVVAYLFYAQSLTCTLTKPNIMRIFHLCIIIHIIKFFFLFFLILQVSENQRVDPLGSWMDFVKRPVGNFPGKCRKRKRPLVRKSLQLHIITCQRHNRQ